MAGTVEHLVAEYGYWALSATVVLESVGLPVPSEGALVAAAVFAGTTSKLSVWGVVLVAAVSAVVGNFAGFALGRFAGAPMLDWAERKFPRLGKKLRLVRTIFEEKGGRLIVMGRFVSVLRTYVAIIAGASRQGLRAFTTANLIGSALWALVLGIGCAEVAHTVRHVSWAPEAFASAVMVGVLLAGILWLRRLSKNLPARTEVPEHTPAPQVR